MINLSFSAPSSSLTPISSSMPSATPKPSSGGDGGGGDEFSRSLDRVQSPPATTPPASKVRIDSPAEKPDADGAEPVAAGEKARSLDALGAMQRTAVARQAALRSASQAAQAGDSARADLAARAAGRPGDGATTGPVGLPDELPASGPTIGPDCELYPDATPPNGGVIVEPPISLPAEVPTPRRPQAAGGADDKSAPVGPGRLPPLLDNETLRPQRPGQDVAVAVKSEPVKTDDAPAPISLPALLPPASQRLANDATSSAAAQGAAAAAVAALAPSTDAARSEPVTQAQAQLQGRPGSSEFAQALGAQVAVWARDGVQRASLQLNPLELGPVSVQIQLDGSGAQVMLAADLAATRQALEQALPALAGSLREAGLTLTGGGVFDQARQQTAADGSGNGTGNGGNLGDTRRGLPGFEGETAQRVALNLPRSRGVVDLIA